MDRINPRHLLRDVIKRLAAARCPECGRAFDAEQAQETSCHYIQPLNCSWCGERATMLHTYSAWLRQDQALRDTPATREYIRRVQADQRRRVREWHY